MPEPVHPAILCSALGPSELLAMLEQAFTPIAQLGDMTAIYRAISPLAGY